MKEIIIFGAGDIARLAKYYFDIDSDQKVVAFCVDRAYRTEDTFLDLPVVNFEEVAEKYPPSQFQMFVALSYNGMNSLRAEKVKAAQKLGYALTSYISSHCTYLSQFKPGYNCFILEDNTIQPYVKIGNNVTLWSGNHIGHDSSIGDHTFISSHVVVSGHVHIGESCFIGVNATLRNSIKIADRSLIGAGATIMKDTEVAEVYVPERTKLFPKSSSEIKL
jgi:sugar O-acyltransferase (sialic acid O-acetyltransferase NeuD family)